MRLLPFALLIGTVLCITAAPAMAAGEVEEIVGREVQAILPPDGIGGLAVAVRVDGRTIFLNYRHADLAGGRPVTSDSLFNIASLRKLFEATLVTQAVERGELRLDDRVSQYVVELQQGDAIRAVTIGQLATYTSGLLLRQDYPPWPDWGYTLPEFIRTLNAWKPDKAPGTEHTYTHAGYVLLQLALERRFGMPIGDLMQQRILKPLGLSSTALPPRGPHDRAELAPALMPRAVQGYFMDGTPIGKPGDQQGYYHFAGTAQMFSSARDLAIFLAANLGELPNHVALQAAMQFAQRPVVHYAPRHAQALAWEVNYNFDPPIVEKNAGLNNTSGYLGMMPTKRIGIVILANRGSQDAAEVGRRIIARLARR
jgi:beta-lactamase class C